MLFSSISFLFVFLPILLLLYYLSPRKFKNYILLLFSVLFYAWGGVSYAGILIFSIAINYFMVDRIYKAKKPKAWLISGLIFNILLIGAFKYVDFFISNYNSLITLISDKEAPLALTNILLPIGISFYTFQQMSLLWDVYRKEVDTKPSFSETALYISLFPQLIAGPIVRYKDIAQQLVQREESLEQFYSGICRFVIGLFKKIIIANACAEIADEIMQGSFDNLNSAVAWLGILAYTLQIYFDFSAYSDMAIGLGKMFGFKIPENFNYPYISRSIQEFWRRWHISLSTWFRDYVYIPIGGNRKGARKTYFNLFLVFLLTGFWHGATWSFILWGLFHGSFLIVERLGFSKILNRIPSFLSWAYTLFLVMIGWVLFRIEELADALAYIKSLFLGGSEGLLVQHLNLERVCLILLGVLFSAPVYLHFSKFIRKLPTYSLTVLQRVKELTLIIMLLVCTAYIISGSYNPFIYFNF